MKLFCYAFLFLALLACSSSIATATTASRATPPVAMQTPDPFPEVIQKALKRAGRSYKPETFQIPEPFRNLTEEQWRNIKFKYENAPWRLKNLNFDIEPRHTGFLFPPVKITIVDDSGTTALPFSADAFDYGNKALADKARETRPGFGGFEVLFPLHGRNSQDAVVSFNGAGHFRAMGKHSRLGAYARTLALNTALPAGEEFAFFNEFWIVMPQPGDTTLVVCALMEAPGMTGAYRFTITPGTSTVMNVENHLFLRKGAPWPSKLGIAPLASMFLHGEAQNGNVNDYRPEVHLSDGLLLRTSDNAWSWSPLVNPARLAVNTFHMENLRGFGLMQRDNAFDNYQDIDARFDMAPSVWVEPQSEWGKGRIEVIEIPNSEEIHNNIIAFWVPDFENAKPETTERTLAFAYTIYWMTPGVTPHSLGRVTATRIVRTPRTETIKFIIDFEGEELRALPADTGLTSLVTTPNEAPITDKQLRKNTATGGWRLSFSAKIPRQDGVMQSIISARDGSPRLRFRALLKKGENLPNPLTEEWVYDLVP